MSNNTFEAFGAAVESGRLSEDPNAPNWVALYAWKGERNGSDQFKHKQTGDYLSLSGASLCRYVPDDGNGGWGWNTLTFEQALANPALDQTDPIPATEGGFPPASVVEQSMQPDRPNVTVERARMAPQAGESASGFGRETSVEAYRRDTETSKLGELATLADSKLYFPVFERSMRISGPGGEPGTVGTVEDALRAFEVPRHKAICRHDPEDPSKPVVLGVTGSGYKVVPHSELFGAVETAIANSMGAHALEGAKVRDHVSRMGAWGAREYVFPEVSKQIEQAGTGRKTSLGFRAMVWNTYDGSGKAKVVIGLMDFLCANVTYSGDYDVFAKKHTAGFSIPDLTKTIENGLGRFDPLVEQMQTWAQSMVTAEDVEKALKGIPGMSERRQKHLLSRFQREAALRGSTAWALYSAMTYYSSHNSEEFKVKQGAQDTVAETLNKRGEEVAKWIKAPSFLELTRPPREMVAVH